MLLHALDASQSGHHNFMISTVDTDVVVISITCFAKLRVDTLGCIWHRQEFPLPCHPIRLVQIKLHHCQYSTPSLVEIPYCLVVLGERNLHKIIGQFILHLLMLCCSFRRILILFWMVKFLLLQSGLLCCCMIGLMTPTRSMHAESSCLPARVDPWNAFLPFKMLFSSTPSVHVSKLSFGTSHCTDVCHYHVQVIGVGKWQVISGIQSGPLYHQHQKLAVNC